MKKQFENIIKSLLIELESYETYRSDFGCQVYVITSLYMGKKYIFSDSYIIMELDGKENILKRFKKEIEEFKETINQSSESNNK